MTYQSAQTANYSTNFAENVRDAITAETGFTIVEDFLGATDPNGDGDYIVVSTPAWEDVLINWSASGRNGCSWDNGDDVGVSMGRNWATDGSQWGEEHVGYNSSSLYTNSSLNNGDQVKYWIEATPRGFVLAAARNEADGNDASMYCAWEEVQKLWDYTTAQTRESGGRLSIRGSSNANTNGTNGGNMDHKSRLGGGTHTTGRGLLNPDANFSNYPWTETLHKCSGYQNTDTGEMAIIGTSDLYLEERSSTDTTTGDTIQDSGGSDIYEILKLVDDLNPIAIRMD